MNSHIIQNDFEFVRDLSSDFLSRSAISKTLKFINDEKISDWEKWMQIEFAKFCRTNERVSSAGREARYALDKRMSGSKQTCSIDFKITETRKRSSFGIEFKQNTSARACINAMCSDVKKTWCIRGSWDDLRSIWCVGVHMPHPHKGTLELIEEVSAQKGILLNPKQIFNTAIGRTGFHLSVF